MWSGLGDVRGECQHLLYSTLLGAEAGDRAFGGCDVPRCEGWLEEALLVSERAPINTSGQMPESRVGRVL